MNHILPWTPVLCALATLSAFFSASEAAFFSLETERLNTMKNGSVTERRIARLMERSERLLSALLFGNLIVNMFFFSIISVITLKIQPENAAFAGTFSMCALLLMIIFCELLPKAVALLLPQPVAYFAAFPLTGVLWLFRPILPVLTLGKDLSLRLFIPKFQTEPILELKDLEKAVNLSQGRRTSSSQDKAVLQSLLSLSEVSAREIMRPRTWLPIFSKPLSIEALKGANLSCGWIFIQESEESNAIERAFPIRRLVKIPPKDYGSLERYAPKALYVPWNLSIAGILDLMRKEKQEIAVVVDEYGATPGVVLLSDILESTFAPNSERASQLTDRLPIRKISDNRWEVSGLYSLRAFCHDFNLPLPDVHETTIGGFLTGFIQRLPKIDDRIVWNRLEFRVIKKAPSPLALEVSRMQTEAPTQTGENSTGENFEGKSEKKSSEKSEENAGENAGEEKPDQEASARGGFGAIST